MCLDPCLGYVEWYLRVALEILRIDVLLVLVFVTEVWKLCVALAHSCIAYGDHCRIGVLSVVIVTVVLELYVALTVLCFIWGSLFKCILSPHCYRGTWSCLVCVCRLASVVW